MRHLIVSTLLLSQMVLSGIGLRQTVNKNSNDEVYSYKDVDKKLVLKSKPYAEYTYDACKKGVVGFVLLKAVFRATGKIEDIEVIEGLPEGLTESAIRAAREIKFKPAIKDGHTVSVWMYLEYNFNLKPLPPCRKAP